jgi:hypothetical protein
MEASDAVQRSGYYIEGIEVSDFLLPHYFTQADEALRRNAFVEDISSFGLSDGGYIGFWDPRTGGHGTYSSILGQAALDAKSAFPTRRQIRQVQG